jgi:hypothetical protein
VQLKGSRLLDRPCSAEELVMSQQQLQAFSAICGQLGIARQNVRNIWMFESRYVEIQVSSIFRQTPGPGAGTPIEP